MDFEIGIQPAWRRFCALPEGNAEKHEVLVDISNRYKDACGHDFKVETDTQGCGKTWWLGCRSINPR